MEALFSDYEEVRKSGLFDAAYYLRTYPDVAARNIDPLVHYLEEGGRAGRNPHPDFDGAFYLEQCRQRGEQPNNPLLHYLRVGAARGFTLRRGEADGKPPRKPALGARQPTKPPIMVAIEALGVLGTAGGASRVSLSGWALATAAITEITAAIDGEVVGTACYGLARPDVAGLYPDRPAAGHSGFILAFDLPSPESGVMQPVLTVRTADGEIGHHPLDFAVPPQTLAARIVDPLDPAGAAEEPHPIRLGIDDAAADANGLLRVEGWAVSRVQLEAVEVLLDGAKNRRRGIRPGPRRYRKGIPRLPERAVFRVPVRRGQQRLGSRPENRDDRRHRAHRNCRPGGSRNPDPPTPRSARRDG